MPIKLNPRLERCAGYVARGGTALDIGTDHAYLACFLIESGLSRRVIASDIADGPLSAARQTVVRQGLSERIAVLKSDGLKDIPDEVLCEATDVIIAGMGGELIAEILSHGEKLPRSVNLILQPNSRAAVLRGFLYGEGFKIISESAVRDGRFTYTVINAEYRGEARELTELERTVGRLDPRDPVSREYLENEITRLRSAAKGMAAASSQEQHQSAVQLLSLAAQIEEYIAKALSKG